MKILLGLTILLSMIILNSCSLTYIPSAPVVFNHEKEGDLSIDFKQGGFSRNLQGGYAVSDNFNVGFSVSSLYAGDVTVVSTTYQGTNAYDLNVIGGYYKKFNENTLFEMNAGAGAIFMDNEAYLSYNKLYVQPTIGFTSKSSNTIFNIGLRTLGTSRITNINQQDTIYYSGFLEPFLSLNTGKQVHFLMQAGLSLPIVPYELGEASPFIFNFGIGYSIGTKQKKEAELLDIK